VRVLLFGRWDTGILGVGRLLYVCCLDGMLIVVRVLGNWRRSGVFILHDCRVIGWKLSLICMFFVLLEHLFYGETLEFSFLLCFAKLNLLMVCKMLDVLWMRVRVVGLGLGSRVKFLCRSF
jgi:hypothetical protein